MQPFAIRYSRVAEIDDKKGKSQVSKIDQHLGKKLAEAREALALSPSQVAEAINVTTEDYLALESGSVRIRALHMARLSRVLNQRLSWFYADLPGQSVFSDPGPSKRSV